MSDIENLADVLSLEPIEVNLFRGRSLERGMPRIFGGLVIGQALLSAYRTVENRMCHSLHAYFIRPGDPLAPVLYQVERARDGKSFTTRRVAAIQHGEQIFNLAASFQIHEEGLDHQFNAPPVPDPETLKGDEERISQMPPPIAEMLRKRAIEMRPVGRSAAEHGPEDSAYGVWMKAKANLGDDPIFNQAVLAYASDMGVLEASMRPHGKAFRTPGMQSASLDHAMWFHRPSSLNDWHLYTQDSPSASGARGFTRGAIHSKDGRLIASVAQEGLIRFREPKAG